MTDNEEIKKEQAEEAIEAEVKATAKETGSADEKAGKKAAAGKAKADSKDAPAKKAAAKKPAAKKEAAPKKAAAKKAAPKKAKSRKKAADRTDVKVPTVKALDGKDIKFSPDVFEVDPKIGVLHEVVRSELAARRSGSASTKTRSEVSGGGIKPWRQKGTGRARAGSSRMPHWTGGGVAFGPKPRDYSFKVNRKVRSKALKMALSARVSEGSLKVVDNLDFEEPKTTAAAMVLASLDVAYPLLVLLTEADINAALSFRNIPRVDVCATSDLSVSDIMAARTLVVTSQALDELNRLGESE
ncbi:MAG: 50S ribosomal protein L4 [Thermoleophilia bacterium]